MNKALCLIIIVVVNCSNVYAQKGSMLLSVNAGVNISLTQSYAYKPGFCVSSIFGYKVNAADAITAELAHQTIKFKFVPSGGLNMTNLKFGYRFFPSVKVPIYFHPDLGLGFFSGDYGGKKIQVNTGIKLGYFPKASNGNLNIFTAINQFRFNPSLSLFNAGIGYQFGLSSKK